VELGADGKVASYAKFLYSPTPWSSSSRTARPSGPALCWGPDVTLSRPGRRRRAR
ncbi:hypothetical protein DBR06_SOUSAS20710037, partial [Sousa chinensis]